jgi:hypothetical protein
MDSLINEKYLGIVSVIVLLIGLLFLVKKWPKDIHHTFSQHAATNKASVVYYIGLFTVSLPILAIFLFSWLVPTFNISVLFTILISLSLICQYACTFVPEIGANVKHHQLLAGISALLLLPSLAVLLYVPSVGFVYKIITAVSIVVMVGILTRVTSRNVEYALVLQSVYFVAFFVPIIAIAYI